MTKLNEINKLNSEKLGTPEEKTILAALNNSTMAYGGAGNANTIAEALAQLADVFQKGGGGGGSIVEVGPFTFDFSKPYPPAASGIELGVSFVLNCYLTKVDFFKCPMTLTDKRVGYFVFIDSLIESYTDDNLTVPSELKLDVPIFMGCKNLKTVEMKAVTTVSSILLNMMFKDCKSLETVNIEGLYITAETSSSDLYRMFEGCSKLQSVNMSHVSLEHADNIVARDGTTFEGCSSLTSITLPDVTMFTALSEITEGDGVRTFQGAPLDHDTAMFIINHMMDYKAGFGGTANLYFSSTTCSYLSDDEKAVASGKGWIITEYTGV